MSEVFRASPIVIVTITVVGATITAGTWLAQTHIYDTPNPVLENVVPTPPQTVTIKHGFPLKYYAITEDEGFSDTLGGGPYATVLNKALVLRNAIYDFLIWSFVGSLVISVSFVAIARMKK